MPALSTLTSLLPSDGAFPAGTRVLTANGERAIEHLSPGDELICHDGACATVRRIVRRTVHFRRDHAGRKPVMVRAGALAPGVPAADLIAAPDQFLAVRLPEEEGGLTVTAPAASLTALPGVRTMRGQRRMDLYSICTNRSAIALVEGCIVQLSASLPRRLLDRVTGGWISSVGSWLGASDMLCLTRWQGRRLAQRLHAAARNARKRGGALVGEAIPAQLDAIAVKAKDAAAASAAKAVEAATVARTQIEAAPPRRLASQPDRARAA